VLISTDMNEQRVHTSTESTGVKTIRKQPRRNATQDAVALALYLNTDFPLSQIAETCGLSPSKLSGQMSLHGWREIKQSYLNKAKSLGVQRLEMSTLDRVSKLRESQASELCRLFDKTCDHISKLQLPMTLEDTKNTPDHLLQTPSTLNKLAETLRSTQKSINSALGIADTIDVSLDITALAPQGLLKTDRVDLVPEWEETIEQESTEPQGKTDTLLDECQAFETPGLETIESIETPGGGGGEITPLPLPDRSDYSSTDNIFSKRDSDSSSSQIFPKQTIGDSLSLIPTLETMEARV
jgi:hypothetical protein